MLLAGALGSEKQDEDVTEAALAQQRQQQQADSPTGSAPAGGLIEASDGLIGSTLEDAQDLGGDDAARVARGSLVAAGCIAQQAGIEQQQELAPQRAEIRAPPLPQGLQRFVAGAGAGLLGIFRHVRCQVDGERSQGQEC